MNALGLDSAVGERPRGNLKSRIKWRQRAHAGAMLVLPATSLIPATYQVVQREVSAWQPILALAGYALTMLAITVGYHRLLAHRAFRAPAAVRAVLLVLASMAGQGPPIYWASNHRRHHRHVEREADPHSPNLGVGRKGGRWRGFWHAHVGWTFGHSLTNALQFSPDLLRDPLVRNISRRYALWVALGVVIPALIGGVVGRGILGVWHGLVWGVGVRLFLSYHLTSSINSITHMYGYRRFDTPDCSRNNLWLGWITFGEGWHNNHHAAPASAHFGRAWWEVDPGSLLIRALRRCSLASDVRAQPGLRGRLHRALAP